MHVHCKKWLMSDRKKNSTMTLGCLVEVKEELNAPRLPRKDNTKDWEYSRREYLSFSKADSFHWRSVSAPTIPNLNIGHHLLFCLNLSHWQVLDTWSWVYSFPSPAPSSEMEFVICFLFCCLLLFSFQKSSVFLFFPPNNKAFDPQGRQDTWRKVEF